MYVGRKCRRVIEGTYSYEAQDGEPAVLAPNRSAAKYATENTVRLTAIRRHLEALQLTARKLDPLGFDEGIQNEC